MKIAFYGDSLTEAVPGMSYVEIIRREHPAHEIINYGKGGDTVRSLTARIREDGLTDPVDLAFVWIGVNDMLVHTSPTAPLIKTLMGQPWAPSPKAFRDDYHALLDTLTPIADHVVSVPPLLIGERQDNEWNRRLDELGAIICEVAGEYSDVEALDLRPAAFAMLNGREASGYLMRHNWRVLLDAFTLKTPAQVAAKAQERGLILTLDGVHLSPAGARLAAEAFGEVIETLNG